MDKGTVPVRHPHFTLDDTGLRYLVSRRPCLQPTEAEREAWRRLPSRAGDADPFGDAEVRRDDLARLIDVGAVVLVPAMPSRAEDRRRRILVFEAHMDDAVLSLGGTMLALRRSHRFEVVTVCGRSNFTSYWHTGHDYFDEGRVTAVRTAESGLALRTLGGEHRALSVPEAPLRGALGPFTREWYRGHAKLVDARIGHPPSDADVRSWAALLETEWTRSGAEEIWLPLGVGSHTDHETLRMAWTALLARRPELAHGGRVCLYRDVPYIADFPDHEERIHAELQRAGAGLVPESVDLRDLIDGKLDLVAIYASQFKRAFISPRVRRAALAPWRGGPPPSAPEETRFRIRGRLGAVDAVATYSGRDAVAEVQGRVGRWCARVAGGSRLRVVSAEPLPRPRELASSLRRIVGAREVELHVRADHLPTWFAPPSREVDVRVVSASRWAWFRRLARVSLAPAVPTVVISGRDLWRVRALAHGISTRAPVVGVPSVAALLVALERSRTRESQGGGNGEDSPSIWSAPV